MPNALAVDSDSRKIFWGDARLDKIERVDMDYPTKRIVLSKASPQHPFDMAVHGDYLFYTDWVLHAVVRINKYSGEGVSWLKTDIRKPMSLVAVGTKQRKVCKEHPCSFLNGGCEDICEVDERGSTSCKCHESRYPLTADNTRCQSKYKECRMGEDFRCSTSDFAANLEAQMIPGTSGGYKEHELCIPYNLTCDGIDHCPDGSDEVTDYCTKRKCNENFFQCRNNRCILPSLKCNDVDDCGDFSDELNCPTCTSNSSRFQCQSGLCIPLSHRCDSKPDCPPGDVSDELNCTKIDCSSTNSLNNQLLPLKGKDIIRYNWSQQRRRIELIPCNKTTACILPAWICDGQNDCWDNSDEEDCSLKVDSDDSSYGDNTCAEGMHTCLNSRCISYSWVCDGEDDCYDSKILTKDNSTLSSDESEDVCGKYECRKDQFQCETSYPIQCIPQKWHCDGTPDCMDKSDESDCDTSKLQDSNTCKQESEFYCRPLNDEKGFCIPLAWVCDGDSDCVHDNETSNAVPGTDEDPEVCQKFLQNVEGNVERPPCLEDDFRCLNGRCISRHYYCDHDNDCGDGSDEPHYCVYEETACPRSTHYCPSIKNDSKFTCIPQEKVCDGMIDCVDHSDEILSLCKNVIPNINTSSLAQSNSLSTNDFDEKGGCHQKNHYQCKNDVCISLDLLCNGQDDCGDYSDEMSCNINECEDPNTCSHICVDKKIGYQCLCNHGYKIQASNPSLCEDINECEEERPCSQVCINTPGSYKCLCNRGYLPLEEGKRCKADGSDAVRLLFSSGYYVKVRFIPDPHTYFSKIEISNGHIHVYLCAIYILLDGRRI